MTGQAGIMAEDGRKAATDAGSARREPQAEAAELPLLRIDSVVKKFGAFRAVDQLSLDIRAGEFFALLGPSGCGKTTLLRMLAGVAAPAPSQYDVPELCAVSAFDRARQHRVRIKTRGLAACGDRCPGGRDGRAGETP